MTRINLQKTLVSLSGLALCVFIVWKFSGGTKEFLLGLLFIFAATSLFAIFSGKNKSRSLMKALAIVGEKKELSDMPEGSCMVRGYCQYDSDFFNVRVGVDGDGLYLYKYGCFCFLIKWKNLCILGDMGDGKLISFEADGCENKIQIPWKRNFDAFYQNN